MKKHSQDRPFSTVMTIGFFLMVALGVPLQAFARDQSSAVKVCGFPDAKALEKFADRLFAHDMKMQGVPGAMLVVVKDGKLLFAKGYGYADVENEVPVSADSTIVRAYSVSKAFTATAVMQLYEQGVLDLHKDIGEYSKSLGYDDGYPPVTLANLLTHTSGIPDREEDLNAIGPFRRYSLEQWLIAAKPARVTSPADQTFEYSNYGSSLAGHMVEIAADQPLAAYIQSRILAPLGMRDSSFLWPKQLPERYRQRVAKGYRPGGETGVRGMSEDEGDFANTPAANLLTTGRDIAAFMIAHLNGGDYQGRRILSEENTAYMHRPWLKDDTLEGFGFGFFWRKHPTTPQLFHAGGWYGSVTDMELLPSRNSGFFTWYNHGADEDRKLRSSVGGALMEEYFSGCPADASSE